MKKTFQFVLLALMLSMMCSCATGMPFVELNPSIAPEEQNPKPGVFSSTVQRVWAPPFNRTYS